MIFLGSEVANYKGPFIVAEISGNHAGNFNRAVNLIDVAKNIGADAVKLQCYEASDLTLNNGYVIGDGSPWSDMTLYELYTKSQTPMDWMEPLFKHAQDIGIPIFSSVYNDRGLSILKNINCQAYKIASYEANDVEFIKRVMRAGKPVVISLGTLDDTEINNLLGWLTTEELDRTILLHCISKYPLSFDELGLEEMVSMQSIMTSGDHSIPIGFSCHCDDPGALMLASALGAAMIEVHLNAGDEGDSETEDFEFSFSPEHLRYGIDRAKQARKAVGCKNYSLERPAREFKRSLFVVKNISKGETFTKEHLATYRPYTGLPPIRLHDIIGAVAACDVEAGTPMKMEYIK